jgi:putative ABC transport system permease protein
MLTLLRRLWYSLRRSRHDADLLEEIETHRALRQEALERDGVTPEDAAQASRRSLGNVTLAVEDAREAWVSRSVDSVKQDVRIALRGLRKSPAFSVVAILSLATGIGATTTIFTFVNAVFLRPLPYPDADRLVVMNEHQRTSSKYLNVHPANFAAWRERARSFEVLALVQAPPLNVINDEGAEQIGRLRTTPEIFRVFGVAPVLGRGFTEEEGRPGGADVAILGHGFWQRWFGGRPDVLGRELKVQGGSLIIIGVAPRGFRVGAMEPEIFTRLIIDPADPANTGSRSFQSYGRLARGVSLETAVQELDLIQSSLEVDSNSFAKGMGVFVSNLQEALGRDARPGLRLLMGVAVVVLVIACVNLAGLLLAHGIARRGEMAVRASLGASRERMTRQLVVESLTLAMIGGAFGVGLAFAGTQALTNLAGNALTGDLPGAIRPDVTSLLFALAVSVATALFFGWMPARETSRADPNTAMRAQTRSATSDRGQHRLRSTLVITEAALAVVLLVGALLLQRSYSNLSRVNLGFRPEGAITAGLFLGQAPPETRIALLDQILERVETLPGVVAAGTIQFLPLRGATCGTGFWQEQDASRRDKSQTHPTECSLVSRGYFEAMGIPVVEGRAFGRGDLPKSPRVLMVNEAFARQYFPDGRVIGKRVAVQWDDDSLAEIVGLVADVHHVDLITDPAPMVYLLHAQSPGYITNLVVRTNADSRTDTAALRRVVREVDPTQALSNVGALERDVAKVLAPSRLRATLVQSVAIVALALAAMGLYGLLAYIVTQRKHEISIRMALGAPKGVVFGALLGQGARLVGIGLLVGLGTGVGLRSLMTTFVFGVTPGDPATFAAACGAFLFVAMVAITIPALRAAQVEPVRALREE